MKKFALYLVFALMAFTPFLQSCDDDDSYSLNSYMIRMATVEKEAGTIYPYFVLDNGKTVWIAASQIYYEGLEAGQRVIVNITLLADNKEGFDYYARLNTYRPVLTKGVINLNEDNVDSIGNSKATITDMWVGADYLNVEFWMVRPSNESHMVNLVDNRMIAPDNDGYAHLEFRYNNMGDDKGSLTQKIVSFNLGDYGPVNKDLKGLKVKINSIKNGEKVLTFDYPEKDGESTVPELTNELGSENLQ